MKANNQNSIKKLDEEFIFHNVKELDSRNRINIGSDIVKAILKAFDKVDSFEIFLGSEGDILLRPSAHIPSRELWLYKNPEALKMVQKGLKEAKEGKVTKVKDLDKFLDEL